MPLERFLSEQHLEMQVLNTMPMHQNQLYHEKTRKEGLEGYSSMTTLELNINLDIYIYMKYMVQI